MVAMVKITYTQELMGTMALFDRVTHVSLKDCFEDKNQLLTFVVDAQDIGRAIGKQAVCVKRLEQLLKRKVRVLGFHADVREFVKYVIYPLQVAVIELENGILYLKDEDRKTKSLLIGRNAQNLRNTEATIQRFFPEITEVKVE
ncbi:NusA-like transcription termination signal-binding factor [Candidatus Woesearchaeota archaeon]|nr:NusA-like transcription termination signal-binding factor [Candidatus Woesearchaeota archaeon]